MDSRALSYSNWRFGQKEFFKSITVLQFLLDWGLARFSGSCGFLFENTNRKIYV